jgi:hypothetical protein
MTKFIIIFKNTVIRRSIPIALTEAWENGKIKTGDTVVLAALEVLHGKCYHKMVILMSIESSYEYKTWNLNIPGFL